MNTTLVAKFYKSIATTLHTVNLKFTSEPYLSNLDLISVTRISLHSTPASVSIPSHPYLGHPRNRSSILPLIVMSVSAGDVFTGIQFIRGIVSQGCFL